LLRRYVAAESSRSSNVQQPKQNKTNERNKRSRKWQTPFVLTNGTAAERTLPDDPKKKRKEKEKEKLADGWTKTHQPLLIPYPFSSLAPFSKNNFVP